MMEKMARQRKQQSRELKSRLLFVSIVMVVMTAVPAGAASVGDPETQGKNKVAAGIEWSYVFGRDLDFIKAVRPPGRQNDRPLNFRISKGQDLVSRISYGLFKAVDIYIKLGVVHYDFKGDVFVGNKKTVEEKLTGGDSFLYGGGFKLAYEIKPGWIVGCDAQYLTSDHELDFSAIGIPSGAVTKAKYYTCRVQEWHAAPYLAKRIADLTPYVGVKYSDLRLDQGNPNDPRRWNDLIFNSDYNVGVFAGIDWNFRDIFRLNVEGRFVDETAMSVGAVYRF
ncbi:MAG: hypothetical protein PHI59_00010 [Candidatus Omnitrophica bacterium]|nr:hypothetical protein [Candidatus Omnitrophota bacterium]